VDTSRLAEWWERARERSHLLDLAGALHDRDQDAYGSVLGGAAAYRLFLFTVPATVVLVGLMVVLHAQPVLEEPLESSVTTGEVARSLSGSSSWQAVSLVAVGLVLTLWAGRSLTRVLATCAGASWQMTARESRVPPITVVALSGILFASILASSVFARIRDIGGVTVTLTAWVGVAAASALAWFLVMLTLPRRVNDPGALLPGALVTGVCFAALQAVMYHYLPGRVARTTDTYGDLAHTIAVLGNFFFIGRLMSASFVLSAVVYERHGSLSGAIFELPGVRRLPARYPWLVSFFDLAPTPSGADPGGDRRSGTAQP
jgi:uncharacterized BrkB/YihY/UPF0761 family membrane protein